MRQLQLSSLPEQRFLAESSTVEFAPSGGAGTPIGSSGSPVASKVGAGTIIRPRNVERSYVVPINPEHLGENRFQPPKAVPSGLLQNQTIVRREILDVPLGSVRSHGPSSGPASGSHHSDQSSLVRSGHYTGPQHPIPASAPMSNTEKLLSGASIVMGAASGLQQSSNPQISFHGVEALPAPTTLLPMMPTTNSINNNNISSADGNDKYSDCYRRRSTEDEEMSCHGEGK